MRKQNLAFEIYKIVRIHCYVTFWQKVSTHTNCVSYYDDNISCDITKLGLTRCIQLYQSFW